MKTKEEKTKELIAALKLEAASLAAQSVNTSEHKQAIEYLEGGIIPTGYHEDLLDAAINDFDCLYSDYCLNK